MKTEELAKHIRLSVLDMCNRAGSSHIGSAFSIADIVAVLYGGVMRADAENPESDDRDRFVLSKGHAGAAVYAALAEVGYFDKKLLESYCKNGSILSGHISHKAVPGVEVSTGSLGHGAPVAAGMAWAAKSYGKQHHVYTIIGDGECNEGSIWEMVLFANHFKLSNLTVIIDCNRLQSLGLCEDTLENKDLAEKWALFGWSVTQADGHDHDDLRRAFSHKSNTKPNCIVAHTTKGKGVSFMENNVLWHYRDPQGEVYAAAKKELEAYSL